MSYFSMIFSQCTPGRLYSAARWHAGFFFPLHITASKTSSMAPGTKTINKHSIFSFFLCYLIKKKQSHDFWLSTNKHFRNDFSSHGSLTRDLPLSASLLGLRRWAGSLTRECNWESCWAHSLAFLFIRLQATWENICGIFLALMCTPSLSAPIFIPSLFCG